MSRSKTFVVPGWVMYLARLVQSWWLVDRIRVSPREGHLWRLSCGTLLNIDDAWYQIVGRTVRSGQFGVELIYECTSGEQFARLIVTQTATAKQEIVLHRPAGGPGIALDVDVIEVFPRTRRC